MSVLQISSLFGCGHVSQWHSGICLNFSAVCLQFNNFFLYREPEEAGMVILQSSKEVIVLKNIQQFSYQTFQQLWVQSKMKHMNKIIWNQLILFRYQCPLLRQIIMSLQVCLNFFSCSWLFCTVWKFQDFFYHSDFTWNQFWWL